ncbi:MAG TPA: OmpA family protein [Bacteroidales bacterium]|nr:OmpA family protein [Bacteroidales bacterium]HSA44094.1 OmpA family protein [Bacteroidales bacterium]
MRLRIVIFLIFTFPLACLQAQDSCPPATDKKALKLYEQAEDDFKRKNFATAFSLCKKVLEEEADAPGAYFMMGLINFKRSVPNYQAAEKNFLKVLEICPGYHPYIYFYLGDIAYSNEQYREAMDYMEAFLKDVDKVQTDQDYDRAAQILKYSKFYIEMTGKPVPFKPMPVRDLCTSYDEYLPILSPDNEIAFFTRNVKMPPNKNDLIPREKFVERFMFASRENGIFDRGNEMPYPFNQYDNEGGASVTVNNRFLVYTRCKYEKGTYYNCDICYSEKQRGEWDEIRVLGSQVNLPDAWDSQPSISADGSTVYFVSDRPGGLGGYDIYKTVKSPEGNWSKPENLGPEINSRGNEKSPFIHPDNKTLYFSSTGHMGMGGYDIFFVKAGDDGKWGKPRNIGYPINSTSDDVGFFVSTDGHYGYFASNKLEGPGGWDVFFFDLYPEARPEKVLLVKGQVKVDKPMAQQNEPDPWIAEEPVKARVELKNVSTRKVTQIPVDTLTGEYAAVVLFRNDYIMTVKKEGFGFESKYIAVEDTVFKAPAKVDMTIKPIELGQTFKLNDVYFNTDSYELTAESRIVIDGFREFLIENPDIKVSIEGHTDDVGNDDYNLKLSDNRAKSVNDYLVEKGIPAGRLSYKGFGESKAVAPNTSEEGRAKNRRTVFVIVGK